MIQIQAWARGRLQLARYKRSLLDVIDIQASDVDVRDGRYGHGVRDECIVYLFGNNSTVVEVTGYRPCISIELPPKWKNIPRWNRFAEQALRDVLFLRESSSQIRVSFVEAKQFLGYHADRKKYLVVSCQTMAIRYNIARLWGAKAKKKRPVLHSRRVKGKWVHLTSVPKDFQYVAVNASCPPSVNFLRQIGGNMGGWIRVRGAEKVASQLQKTTWMRHYYVARVENLKGVPRQRGIATPSILSYDIETMSDGKGFCKARRPQDTIIVIGTYFRDAANDVERYKSFVLDTEAERGESAMLLRFAQYVRDVDPDCFVGFNTFTFDNEFMFDKLELMKWFATGDRTWEDVLRCRGLQKRYEELETMYEGAVTERQRDEIAMHMNRHIEGNKSKSTFRPNTKRIWAILSGKLLKNGERENYYETKEEFEKAREYFSAEDPQAYEKFFQLLSRKKGVPARYNRKKMSSQAMGSCVISFPSGTGRINLDVWWKFKTSQYRLLDYKLNTLSKHFLGGAKLDLPYATMFRYWRSGDPEKRAQVVKYCERDCELPVLLLDKVGVVMDYVEESRLTGVSVAQLCVCGQGVKTKTLLYRYGLEMGYHFNECTFFPPKIYKGATVLPPHTGFYDRFVLCHDFASLYPSIIIQFNLCYSTYIPLPTDEDRMDPRVLKISIKKDKVHYFRQDRPGVLPTMLKSVLSERKKVKGEMKQAEGQLRDILNAKQVSHICIIMVLSCIISCMHTFWCIDLWFCLFVRAQKALKVVANATYGFTGRKIGELLCTAISESVTSIGRRLIGMTMEAVEKDFKSDARVIYGDTDSVMSLTDFGPGQLDKAWALGLRMEKHFNDVTFGAFPAIIMEMEKAMLPYILYKKKRY